MILTLPSGLHSTWGMGCMGPNPAMSRTLDDGVLVPIGKPHSKTVEFCLLYNEYPFIKSPAAVVCCRDKKKTYIVILCSPFLSELANGARRRHVIIELHVSRRYIAVSNMAARDNSALFSFAFSFIHSTFS